MSKKKILEWLCIYRYGNNMSCVMRKPAFCICENKDADIDADADADKDV